MRLYDKSIALLFLKFLVPILLGCMATWLLYANVLSGLHYDVIYSFSKISLYTIITSVILMFIRDAFVSLRFRMLCLPDYLSWKSSFRATYLCEFTSAVTPSAIGGSACILYFLHREGVSAAKSSSVMITTLFFDELVFVIVCPLCLVIYQPYILIGQIQASYPFINYTIVGIYIMILVYTMFLFFSLFINTDLIAKCISCISRQRILRKYKEPLLKYTDDLRTSNLEIKKKSMFFWLKMFMLTLLAWVSRFSVACVLLSGFTPLSDQFLILSRQFILWIVMTVVPTPGGSGASEFLFSQFYSGVYIDASISLTLVMIWRFITFYVYLLVGLVYLPSLMHKNSHSKSKQK